LKWLNDGNFYRTQEADIGKAYIVEGLEDELQRPDAENRSI